MLEQIKAFLKPSGSFEPFEIVLRDGKRVRILDRKDVTSVSGTDGIMVWDENAPPPGMRRLHLADIASVRPAGERIHTIRVILADDHDLFVAGIQAILDATVDIEPVATAGNGGQAVLLCKQLKPDVVLMDIAMPRLNGLEATRQIRAEQLPCKVLVVSSYSDDEYVRQLLEAGAAGYLIKQCRPEELLNAIRVVHKGKTCFSPSISKRLLDYYREAYVKGKSVKQQGELTARELEVLQLIAEGKVNKQIASALCVSIKTVEKHRQQVMNKINIHDIAGLTRYAISRGIIESSPQLP